MAAHLGIDRSCGKILHMRNVWTGEEFDINNEIYYPGTGIEPHSCELLRVSLKDAK